MYLRTTTKAHQEKNYFEIVLLSRHCVQYHIKIPNSSRIVQCLSVYRRKIILSSFSCLSLAERHENICVIVVWIFNVCASCCTGHSLSSPLHLLHIIRTRVRTYVHTYRQEQKNNNKQLQLQPKENTQVQMCRSVYSDIKYIVNYSQ